MKDYKISDFITTVKMNVECEEKFECLKKMAELLARENNLDPTETFSLLKAREKFGSTALGGLFALPHAKMDMLGKLIGGLFVTKDPVNFGSLDGMPSQIFFVILAPSSKPSILLKAVAKIAKVFKDQQLKEQILKAQQPDEILNIIKEKEESLKKG
jgi:mannitol/fructose-specific phosphotransferase system IIA component (Ntr-type)